MKKKFFRLSAAGLLFFSGIMEIGWRFFNMVVCCKRGGRKKERKKWFELSHIRDNHPRNGYAKEYDESRAWCEAQKMQDCYIQSVDGLKLHGFYLPAEHAKRFVILSHGYRGSRFGSLSFMAKYLHEHQCNLLFMEQRCCGESEGKYITFGAKEKQEGTIKTKDEKLTALAQTLAEQEAKLKEQQALLNQQQMDLDEKTTQLSEQQTKIDNIIGVKAEVVEALQKEFQKNNINVNLDSKTGALTLDASVLFDVDESELTDAGKEALRNVLPIYCKVLMEDTYKNYLAEIIIDGYTDTDGDYAYNLELSQQRSLAVAQYLLDIQGEFLTEDQSLDLQDYLTVNGHSMANPILDADGNVDKEASRRVEVKFRLKDDEMIEELSKIMAGSEESAADTATEAGADAAAN